MKWRNRLARALGWALGLGDERPKMRPESTPNPADAGCNSKSAQYSNTPSLRVAGFEDEDDDEDENEAPHLMKICVI